MWLDEKGAGIKQKIKNKKTPPHINNSMATSSLILASKVKKQVTVRETTMTTTKKQTNKFLRI